jgi:hypothetical protein
LTGASMKCQKCVREEPCGRLLCSELHRLEL